ncbi:MAG: DUF4845 domain-containing protein [Gammaproteobacteria bacterium]|nr:DUF4845 domain-containing protein [Gammaproteobacteria bacterium]MBU6508861.1 DUF4845 domain-containing protein [Gammaproteobacteria bacterium]MDE1983484.1 DUF4845 domain-containing protein [Gammaproteobacteria bacterium]MDE2108856.1 DUF4845 domain-containing protein [Gammaproteobacteria bacterium]MDE2460199.1 DUF4845 domain-containing protein [Gammaproteobacteria bacterium]
MNSKQHQAGLTLISWLIILAMVAFIFWFGFSLFTIYYQYYAINNVVKTTAQQVTAGETPMQILHSMDMKFTINGVQDNSLMPEKVVSVVPASNGTSLILTLDYDARTSFIGNVDLIVHFHNTYQATPH